MTSIILYSISILLFVASLSKDKTKTKKAVISALKSFENIMPQFLTIIILVGFILSILDTKTISSIIGNESGFFGVALSSIIGSITMMPTFVAFSTSEALLESGAGYPQVAALVSTLTMVGIMTFSLESQYIGKKAALFRNLIAFVFSFIVALFVGMVFI